MVCFFVFRTKKRFCKATSSKKQHDFDIKLKNKQINEIIISKQNKFNNNTKSIENYIFNINPQNYKHCQEYLVNLEKFLYLDSEYNDFEHYVAINKTDGKLYEIHTHVVGFEGEYVNSSKAVEDFVNPPRVLTIEEFLILADSKYQSISVLYDGISEVNLLSYSNVLDNWRQIPDNKKPFNKWDIDKTMLVYEFEQSWEEKMKWYAKNDSRYPLMAISEYLLSNGFRFIRADVGGGVDEVSHTGAVAYDAEYTSFESFRDNFDSDYDQADAEATEKYGQWFSHLNYEYIAVEYAIEETHIKIILFTGISWRLRIIWSNLKDEHTALVEKVNSRMKEILVGDSLLTKTVFIK